MKRLLLVGPNPWDLDEAVPAAERRGVRCEVADDPGFHVEGAAIARRCLTPFDLDRWLDRTVRERRPDGVIGTDDYLSCAAAAVLARRLDLPGPHPRSVLLAQHKLLARRAVGSACPDLAVDHAPVCPQGPTPANLKVPYWIKPVRGTFSVLARRVEHPDALGRLLAFSLLERRVGRNLVHPFQRLLEGVEAPDPRADLFIAERELRGRLVTVEGFAAAGAFTSLGVTDSTFHPGTAEFLRFDYPSSLPGTVQRRMVRAAERVAAALRLQRTVFNAEFFWDEREDRVDLLEINPRMAYQFADLHEKVDGWNTYDLQVALALGEVPTPSLGSGPHRAAVSYVMRHFGAGTVVRAPSDAEVQKARREHPGARIRIYARAGDRLRPDAGVASHRLAVINLGGSCREELDASAARATAGLPFQVR